MLPMHVRLRDYELGASDSLFVNLPRFVLQQFVLSVSLQESKQTTWIDSIQYLDNNIY